MPKCDKCERVFSNNANLKYHVDHNSCKVGGEDRVKCEHCPRTFCNRQAMIRHAKNSCHMREERETGDDVLRKEIEKLRNELAEFKKTTYASNCGNSNRECSSLHNEGTMSDDHRVINSNNIINTNSNNTNNTNITNVTHVTLVAYGYEDIERLGEQELLGIVGEGYSSVVKLVDKLHFNEELPEYNNLYIPSLKDKHARMYDGSDWVTISKGDFVDRIYDDKSILISNKYDEYHEDLKTGPKSRYRRWQDSENRMNESTIEAGKINTIKSNIERKIYDKKNLPIKTKKEFQKNGAILVCRKVAEKRSIDHVEPTESVEPAEPAEPTPPIVEEVDDPPQVNQVKVIVVKAKPWVNRVNRAHLQKPKHPAKKANADNIPAYRRGVTVKRPPRKRTVNK